MTTLSFDEKASKRGDSRTSLPLSESTTERGSMSELSISSSETHPEEPNWPKSWKAYACLLGCFFLMFNSWGLVNAYGTFASYYVGHSLRAMDQLELNLIGSTQSFWVLLLSGVVGRVLDAGHFRYVIGLGAVLVPFGMFMLSVAHPNDETIDGGVSVFAKIWVTQGTVVGLGMACFFVSSSQVAATWFPNRKGLAVGFVACGASIAGVVYPSMLRYLIDSVGFNDAVRYVATLVAATAAFSFFFSVPDPQHQHNRTQKWGELRTWVDTTAFKNPAFRWFTAAVALLFLGFYPVFFNLEEWAAVSGFGTRDGSSMPMQVQESDSRPIQTFWLLAILNGCSTVGRATMATFSDRTGQLNMHIVSQFVSAILVFFLWTFAKSTTDAIAFCVVFGMFSGAVIGLPPASMANILNCSYRNERKTAHAKLGHWTGMMYTFAAIPSLVGPVVAGHLVTEFGTYITVQMWCGACLLLSAGCMVMSRWYLPCYDGELVGTKVALKMGKHVDAPAISKKGKGKSRETVTGDSNIDLEAGNGGISQSTTRVPSAMVSRQVSDDKLPAMPQPASSRGAA